MQRIKIQVFQSCMLMVVSLLLVSVALAASPAKTKAQIDLNTATEKELSTLPGIGPATAQAIIAARPFKSVEDLEKVKGIGKTKYNALKDMVTVKAVAAAPPAAAPPAAVSGAARPATKPKPININIADPKTLQTLPGMNAALIKSIIAARPFKSVAELQKIKGMDKAEYDAIKGLVTAAPININTADPKTLEALPGIGAATAKNIIAARPFKNVDDLEKVNGIGKTKYAALKNMVSIKDVAEPRPGAEGAGAAQAGSAGGTVDINTADQKTLEALPGIGAATAKSIIAARPFKSVEDLQNVKGIGKAKFEALKDKVTVGGAVRAPSAPATREPATPVVGEKPGAPAKQPSARETKPAGEKPGAAALPTGPIDINTADLKTLEALPEIGPVKAQAIIDHRPYTKIEDIMKVPGIKEGIFARIKDQIVVK